MVLTCQMVQLKSPVRKHREHDACIGTAGFVFSIPHTPQKTSKRLGHDYIQPIKSSAPLGGLEQMAKTRELKSQGLMVSCASSCLSLTSLKRIKTSFIIIMFITLL